VKGRFEAARKQRWLSSSACGVTLLKDAFLVLYFPSPFKNVYYNFSLPSSHAYVFKFSYFTLPTQSLPKVVHRCFGVNFLGRTKTKGDATVTKDEYETSNIEETKNTF